MLVLTRKPNESVCIGDNIVITVVEIRGDKVRLGFTGPVTVPIHRKEVYDRLGPKPGYHYAKADCPHNWCGGYCDLCGAVHPERTLA